MTLFDRYKVSGDSARGRISAPSADTIPKNGNISAPSEDVTKLCAIESRHFGLLSIEKGRREIGNQNTTEAFDTSFNNYYDQSTFCYFIE